MKTVFEKDSEYFCDIQAPCFQKLLPEEKKLVQQERKQEILQLLSRKDLAEFAGISIESGVKLLKSIEKDGLIELHEKDIRIMNYDNLANISRRG